MTVLLAPDTASAIQGYLTGEMSSSDFEAWFVEAQEELPDAEQTALWEVRLLLTEANEGTRPASEAKKRALQILAAMTAPQRSDSGSTTDEYLVVSDVSTAGTV